MPDFNEFQQFMKNPYEFFSKRGVQIPQQMNNPNDIIDYLLQSGSIKQDDYNKAYSKYKEANSKKFQNPQEMFEYIMQMMK